MPIYVYRCEACQALTEALQKIGDAPLVECSHCKAMSLKKILSPVGIVFKGSGFHKNDYSGKSKSTTPATTSTSGIPAGRSRQTAAPTRATDSRAG